MKKDFSKNASAETSEQTPQELHDAENAAPDNAELESIEGTNPSAVVQRGSIEIGQITGEIDAGDLKIPYLKIAQRTGELAENGFTPGSLVLNSEYLVADEMAPVVITILSLAKCWRERLPYDPNGPMPRTFKTTQEAKDAGLSFLWSGPDSARVPPGVDEQATLNILIEKPEGLDCPAFSLCYEQDEAPPRFYAPAQWIVARTAYFSVAKPVLTKAFMQFKEPPGLPRALWEISVHPKEKNGFKYKQPTIKHIGMNEDAFIEWIRTVMT